MRQKVIIVEPSEIIRTGLKAVIDSTQTHEVVASVEDLSVIEERIAYHRPDVIIVNPILIATSRSPQLPDELSSDDYEATLVALVHSYVSRDCLRLFEAVIEIDDNRERIIEVLSSLKDGNSKTGKKGSENCDLTKRETDILVLVAKGMMSKEIADKLNISIHTVISHRKNITKKTGIKSVAGLAVYAMLNNLIEE